MSGTETTAAERRTSLPLAGGMMLGVILVGLGLLSLLGYVAGLPTAFVFDWIWQVVQFLFF